MEREIKKFSGDCSIIAREHLKAREEEVNLKSKTYAVVDI